MTQKLMAMCYRMLGRGYGIAFCQDSTQLRDEQDLRNRLASEILRRELDWDLARSSLEKLLKSGWDVLHPLDRNYPESLMRVECPPVFISFKGQIQNRQADWLSVVGGREPSQEALKWMSFELDLLFRTSIGVVSGGARGIDQMAHRLAIRRGLKTWAFFAAGMDFLTRNQTALLEEITGAGGVVLSEYLPEEPVRKSHFHERNRLIAGMSEVLLIVQCRERSGSLITVRHALKQGKTVAVVPWSPLETRAHGSNRLLFEGAQMVRSSEDLKGLLLSSRPCAPNTN